MKKKILAVVGAVALTLTMTITASAVPATGRVNRADSVIGYGGGMCGAVSYCPMVDDNGDFLDRETFVTNLDKAISDGLINEDNKEFYLERFDYCVANGISTMGGGGRRGGGCGGRGMFYTAP